MKLKVNLTAEEFGELDEALQENYAEQEDGYLLTIDGMTHEDVSGLKSALQKERENVSNLSSKLKEKDVEQETSERYKKRFYAAKRDSKINEVLAMEGGNTELLAPLLREKVRVAETDDGHISYQVTNSEGTRMLAEDGQPLTVETFVKSLKEVDAYKGSFRGINQNGGNSFEGGGSAGPVNPRIPTKRRSLMTNVEKVNYINEHGQKAFNRLPM